MNNKEEYERFCSSNYIPIYSRSWWMDAVCGANNWDVWLYKKGNNILAAMPYYFEYRGKYRYITKALLTQNNGIIFKYDSNAKEVSKSKYEEKIINAACQFIKDLKVDVYEQQFVTTFHNWLPFFWNRYNAITRYTYIFEDTSNLNMIWNEISSKYRSKIKKGQSNTTLREGSDPLQFFREHEKIFKKQNLPSPFSLDRWMIIYNSVIEHNSGKIFYRVNNDGIICSLMFLIWDDKNVYQLLAGSIPEFQNLDSYDALIWDGINFASNLGKKYDFEGSVIPRISKSFREFGAKPCRYFRIRKVFNPEIILSEAQNEIKMLNEE